MFSSRKALSPFKCLSVMLLEDFTSIAISSSTQKSTSFRELSYFYHTLTPVSILARMFLIPHTPFTSTILPCTKTTYSAIIEARSLLSPKKRTALFMKMAKLILLIITFPIWFPIITVASAVIFAFSLAVSLAGFAVTAAAAALTIAGILAFVIFIGAIGNSVASGLMGLGGGCILLGLGLMVGTIGISLCIKLFPWLISVVRRIFAKPFHRSTSQTRDLAYSGASYRNT